MILKMSKKMVYFFDLDGTLVDSSKCHSSAFKKVLAIHYPDICKTFNYEHFKGKSSHHTITIIITIRSHQHQNQSERNRSLQSLTKGH